MVSLQHHRQNAEPKWIAVNSSKDISRVGTNFLPEYFRILAHSFGQISFPARLIKINKPVNAEVIGSKWFNYEPNLLMSNLFPKRNGNTPSNRLQIGNDNYYIQSMHCVLTSTIHQTESCSYQHIWSAHSVQRQNFTVFLELVLSQYAAITLTHKPRRRKFYCNHPAGSSVNSDYFLTVSVSLRYSSN